ncbi:RagB/SusD family nutrient uptake outer membrane protein [Olivibacter ginsenosidimutans]|uniref:RagB/SusD family nutrient uptake outer membrane protein n=1 Tax=Olivibacter ginsenosidimutans TaxID=1176537 RepID=A0ABP9BSZ5_9SPHI
MGCTKILDIEPNDRVSPEDLFASKEGVEAQMANLYGRLPIEDFNYSPNRGFNIGVGSDVNNAGFMAAHFSDEAIHPEYNDFGEEWFDYWEDGYRLIRDINILLQTVPQLASIDQAAKDKLNAEAYFLRAYTYFALAKRYGGVPLIESPQEYNGNIAELKVPRNTEKETWDFILADCDRATELFGEVENGPRRADKWVALALKSRAALFAASIAKFSHQPYVSFSGPAVDQGLVGIETKFADTYYDQCIAASDALMKSGKFALYQAEPASPEEAAENYRQFFQQPDQYLNGVREPIFIKSYATNTVLAHNYDVWFSPRQMVLDPNLYPGRMNPTLDFVDAFEDYTDDGTGKVKPLKTRADGNENDYNGFNLGTNYIAYPQNAPYKIAEGRDARLRAMVLFPGETWGSTQIIIQGGLVKANGSGFYYRTQTSEVGQDGQTYYTFGAARSTQYSGFDPTLGHYTRSGFLFKKFMQIDHPVEQAWERSTQSWIDFRYGEILLNYAEAVVEKSSPTGAESQTAKEALNNLRRRAAHTDQIALTQQNVRKERFVELAFENKRRWDLVRWRTFHKSFENRVRKGLVPFLDLRSNPARYIFVRVNPLGIEAKTFDYLWYYKDIPGTSANGLIQNP